MQTLFSLSVFLLLCLLVTCCLCLSVALRRIQNSTVWGWSLNFFLPTNLCFISPPVLFSIFLFQCSVSVSFISKICLLIPLLWILKDNAQQKQSRCMEKKIIHAMYHTHALVFSQCSRTTPLYGYVLFLLNNFSINYLDMKVQDMSYHGIGYLW